MFASGRRQVSIVAFGVGVAVSAAVPVRANVQGFIDLRLEVVRGCVFTGEPGMDAGLVDLGTIDLGRHARLDSVDAPISGQPVSPDEVGSGYIECNPATPYRVEIDSGLNGGAGDLRFLARQDKGETIIGDRVPYRIFADPARRMPLTAGEALSGITPSSGRVPLPLFVRIDSVTAIPVAGMYRDRVRITLSW